MAQLKTGTSIGQTTLNQGGEVTVTLPSAAGTLLTTAALNNTELTGTPTAPTPAGNTSTTQIATTAFVQQRAGDAEITAVAMAIALG